MLLESIVYSLHNRAESEQPVIKLINLETFLHE